MPDCKYRVNPSKIPISTWGELGFILLQNSIILVLILYYQDKAAYAAILLFFMSNAVQMLVNPSWVSLELLKQLQLVAIGLGIFSKIPQINSIYQNKSTV